MFVNVNVFMKTSSMKLNLVKVEHILSQIDYQLSKSLNKLIKLYEICDFVIHVILVDMEFEKVSETLGIVEVNIESAREHVVEVERTIIIVKERGK